MIPRTFRFFPWLLLTLTLLAGGCGGGGGGGGGAQNLAPVLDPIGNQTVTVGETLSFPLRASDPNNTDTVRIFFDHTNDLLLSTSPGNPASADFNWTPSAADLVNNSDTPLSIKFTASDGILEVSQTIVVTVKKPVNRAPSLAAIDDKVANTGEILAFTLAASDPDGNPLSYSATGLPAGASLNANTGAFSWIPTLAGIYSPTFTVSDGQLTASAPMSITVVPAPVVNSPPAISPIGNRQVTVGQTLRFTVTTSDSDSGDILSMEPTGMPAGAVFSYSAQTRQGEFSWTPTTGQEGVYPITFPVSDGKETAADSITISVAAIVNPNTPPALAAIGNKTATVGVPLSFTVSATDIDGDLVTLGVLGLPNGASFAPDSGLFTWTPVSGDEGIKNLTFEADDGLATVSRAITITVVAPQPPTNTPPVLAPIGNRSVNHTSNLSFTVTASDEDGDALTLSATGIPAGATFNVNSGDFSWTPGPSDVGQYNVTFRVSDGIAPTVEEQIVISVVNNAPVITVTTLPPASVTENELVTILISVNDPDAGDIITVSASGSALDNGGVFSYDTATQTGTFTWTPAIVTGGTYSITFAASDGISPTAKTETISYARTNPLLAVDSGLSGITVFNQSIAALDGNNEVFPGQANFWDLDLDAAIFDGFWDQFDGNMFLSVEDNFGTEFFPADQTYAELSFLTPIMTALDGIKVAAVAHHDSYSGPDPRVPILAVAGEGNYSAWLNTSSDSRLQQLVDLTAASAPVTFSVRDEVLALLGEFQDPGNPPFPHYRIVLRDPTTGAVLQSLFDPPLSTRNAVELSRATRSLNLDPSVLGRKVLLSFEFRAANGALFNATGDLVEYLGSYARIDNVSIRDAAGEYVQNGDFETGNLSGWTTNAARESQNIRFGQRTVNELVVTRHFYAPPNQHWARWVDVFENNTAGTLVKTINLHTILGSWGGAVVYPHPGTTAPDIRALTVWDTGAGDRTLRNLDVPSYRDSGLVFGNADLVSFVSASDLTSADGDDFIDIQHLVVIPPGGSVTLVHFTIMSGESTGQTATDIAARATTVDAERDKILNNFWSDPRYRDGMTQGQIDTIQNLPQGGF